MVGLRRIQPKILKTFFGGGLDFPFETADQMATKAGIKKERNPKFRLKTMPKTDRANLDGELRS